MNGRDAAGAGPNLKMKRLDCPDGPVSLRHRDSILEGRGISARCFMHSLPLWFLVLSLFLPRICLLIAYVQHDLIRFSLSGWEPLALAVLIPRALVLILVFEDRGLGVWVLVHAIGIACTYLGAGSSKR
jgi:hypothetical protein